MKRLVIAAATVALGLLPSAAAAAVKQIDVQAGTSLYCITVDNGPSAVTFTAKAPGGATLATARATTAVAGQTCTGTVTAGVSSFSTSLTTYPGATVVADAGSGVSTTFTVPYAGYDASGTTGIVKVGGLPTAGGNVTINGGGAVAYSGATYTTPAAVTIGGGVVTISSSVGSVPFVGQLNASRFDVSVAYYGSITTEGFDPLGAPITLAATSGGSTIASLSTAPALDDNQYLQTTLPTELPSGAVVTVGQAGWFSHTVTLGSLAVRPAGFDASIPAVAGETGSISMNLTFQATSGLLPSDPLSCLRFGDATYMFAQCGTTGARYSASFPAIVSSDDYVQVDANEPDGDSSSVELRPTGWEITLNDGSVNGEGLGGTQPITLTATTPSHVTASGSQVTYSDGYVGFAEADGPNTYLPLRIVSGTTFTASGPAVGATPMTFAANLEATASGSTVSGTTYPNAHLTIRHQRPSSGSTTTYTTADGNGAFAVDVGAVIGRDTFTVYADEPGTFEVSERTLVPGVGQPAIVGVADQQLVRATINVTATGGGPAGMFWNGDVPGSFVGAAPFGYSLDTTKLPDGPYRLEADTAGQQNSLSDYLYLRIDNTPPTVVAGPAQYIAVGTSAVLPALASDVNGIASLTASFGDGKSLTVPAAAIGQPISHVYAKGGNYTATLTATDAAGNVATSAAAIHVTSTLAAVVSGKVQKTIKHKSKKPLKVKFTSHVPGELSVHVYDAKAKLKSGKVLSFTKANQKLTLSLVTKKWKKGRYTFVLQFRDANGKPGPVVLQQLRIV